MKYQAGGFYRLLWNEFAKSIRFTWHRTRKGAETIPSAYQYKGTISSDYYHHLAEGAKGLAQFAKESNLRIDWKEGRLVDPKDIPYHLCPPDMDERAIAEVLAEMDGKVMKFKSPNDKRPRCPVCGEVYESPTK